MWTSELFSCKSEHCNFKSTKITLVTQAHIRNPMVLVTLGEDVTFEASLGYRAKTVQKSKGKPTLSLLLAKNNPSNFPSPSFTQTTRQR